MYARVCFQSIYNVCSRRRHHRLARILETYEIFNETTRKASNRSIQLSKLFCIHRCDWIWRHAKFSRDAHGFPIDLHRLRQGKVFCHFVNRLCYPARRVDTRNFQRDAHGFQSTSIVCSSGASALHLQARPSLTMMTSSLDLDFGDTRDKTKFSRFSELSFCEKEG